VPHRLEGTLGRMLAAELDRRIVLAVLGIGALACTTGSLIEGLGRRPELALAGLVFAALFLLLWRRPAHLQIVKIGLVSTGVAAVHGRLALGLYRGAMAGQVEAHVPPLGPWVILLTGLVIVLFRSRAGVGAAVVLWTATTGLVVAFLAANDFPVAPRMRLELVNQLVLAHCAFLVLMLVWVRLRLQLARSDDEVSALSSLARTDALTELGNRRAGEELLARLALSASSRETGFGVVLFDIDNFKEINDRFGHDVGDEVIRRVAGVARRSVRPLDSVFRWGGDEYLVAAHGADLQTSETVAERLRRSLEEADFSPVGSVTASLGGAAFEAGDDLEGLLKRADRALYAAKRAGRNCARIGVAEFAKTGGAGSRALSPGSWRGVARRGRPGSESPSTSARGRAPGPSGARRVGARRGSPPRCASRRR